jgi:hypothetical protein
MVPSHLQQSGTTAMNIPEDELSKEGGIRDDEHAKIGLWRSALHQFSGRDFIWSVLQGFLLGFEPFASAFVKIMQITALPFIVVNQVEISVF